MAVRRDNVISIKHSQSNKVNFLNQNYFLIK